MPGQTEGWKDGRTDPILYDPSGYRQGSKNKTKNIQYFQLFSGKYLICTIP